MFRLRSPLNLRLPDDSPRTLLLNLRVLLCFIPETDPTRPSSPRLYPDLKPLSPFLVHLLFFRPSLCLLSPITRLTRPL